jgi:hypothetical protein
MNFRTQQFGVLDSLLFNRVYSLESTSQKFAWRTLRRTIHVVMMVDERVKLASGLEKTTPASQAMLQHAKLSEGEKILHQGREQCHVVSLMCLCPSWFNVSLRQEATGGSFQFWRPRKG